MKIFIINLERVTERKELMLSQIKSNDLIQKSDDLEFIFFEAIDAKQNQHIKFKNEKQSFLTKIIRGKKLVDGEIACWASHFLLWQKCVELNEPVVILEDDVEFLPEFTNGLKEIRESNFEYVRLICTYNKPFKEIKKNFYTSHLGVCGTQGYYLTPAAAQKFLTSAKKWHKPIDDYMDSFWINDVPIIVHIPFLLKDNNAVESSTIAKRENKPNIFFKATREISKIFLRTRKIFYMKIHYSNFINNQIKNQNIN